MSRALLDSGSGRLVLVPDGGPIGLDMVGVPMSVGAGHALLTVENETVGRAAVRLSPLPQVPDGVLAVGRGLAANLGVDAGQKRWRLDAAQPVDAARLRVELLTEDSIDAVVSGLAAAGLPGRVLWHGTGDESYLWVDDVPYRVRAIDTGGRTDVVARITERTEVELFAAGVRSGVDIVILADCSGSMGVDDIERYGEGAPPPGRFAGRLPGRAPAGHGGRISRTQALRQALYDLLEVRLKVNGRVSQVALVDFTERTSARFPRDGGMVELDGSSPPELINEFRAAIAVLSAQDGRGTDIGNALHEAANLLYYSGRPDNEKLIVLVSDGAHWTPRGDQGTGEVVRASEEPVSLMAHLHANTGIRLHAIGISTPELYRHWTMANGFAFNPVLNPNHDLLEQLVAVGGGDPTTIGGLDVLAAYFSGLGAGITRTVRLDRAPARRSGGPLPQEAAAVLAKLGRGTADGATAARARLAADLGELVGRCNTEAARVYDRPLFDSAKAKKTIQRAIESGGSEERDLMYFSRDVLAFKPVTPPPGTRQSLLDRHDDLVRYLDGIRAVSAGGNVDYPALDRLVGAAVHDPGRAIEAASDRLLGLLRGWYEAAAAHEPVRQTMPGSGAPDAAAPDRAVPDAAGARSTGDVLASSGPDGGAARSADLDGPTLDGPTVSGPASPRGGSAASGGFRFRD
ncbi:von Willebrand factor type A domain-containing protein [Actinomadura meyerae]|uniref:von Willebrand factor type A domain-containing protein n=1 Tax=Actinomadura meyerae TaxID=240840 RepID=A0A239NI07_9ACTN|nr:vWA domain-containing protein [Actinomadura meyerae]SNT54182.1 von Willebrand factor type A domain-containing protein [Actinomadura meyerae]